MKSAGDSIRCQYSGMMNAWYLILLISVSSALASPPMLSNAIPNLLYNCNNELPFSYLNDHA